MTVSSLSGAATAAPFFGAAQNHGKAQAATTAGGSSGNDSNSLSAGNLGTTFLSLLVQELQNQDPTQPMDPTEMVGQMISLNQLDQLISINQALTPATSTAAAGSGTPSADTGTPAVPGVADQRSQAQVSASGDPSKPAALDPAQAAATVAAQQAMAAANPSAPLDLGTLKTLLGGK